MAEENLDLTIPAYDVMVFKAEQEREQREAAERQVLAKQAHERKIARYRVFGVSVGWIAAAAAIIGVAYIIWQAVAGPSASEVLENEAKIACIEHDGTWARLADDVTTEGTCIGGTK